jgi:hemoglobin-like flavoprotein
MGAARAALEGIARVKLLSQITKKQFGVELCLRAGIHYGPAVVGEMGHPMQMQQTAIGDAVNIAQRLESTAKEVGANLLVSADLLEQCAGELVTGQRGVRQLKGRGEPSEFVEVSGLAKPDPVFLVQTSFVYLRPRIAEFAANFFQRLVRDAPQLAALFEDADRIRLKTMVAKIFSTTIAGPGQNDQLEGELTDLSRRHKSYGAMPEYLPAIGKAFIETICEALPDDTDPQTVEAWEQLFGNTAVMMTKGLSKDEAAG